MIDAARSLKQQAYDAILRRILRQELLPGELLNRRSPPNSA